MILRSLCPALLAGSTLLLPAQTLQIEPRHCVAQAGAAVAFRVRVPGGAAVPCEWKVQGPGGSIGPDGVFRGAAGTYQVRATSLADPTVFDETGVLVLPDIPALRTVAELLPGTFDPGWSDALPFKDFEGSSRFGDPGQKVEELKGPGYPDRHIIGYGLKVSVDLPHPGLAPDAQLLSYLEGGEPVRRDVTGLASLPIQARGAITRAQVERLNRSTKNAWLSRTEPVSITVRGLLPCAGNPVAGAGDADGRGLSARFRRPGGLALLPSGTLVVADAEAHTLRFIDADRKVSTPLGAAGSPGHADGPPAASRFRAPTFLAPAPLLPGPPSFPTRLRFAVADSGNHVIRAVDDLDLTRTLAGVPGTAGHLDAPDPRQALFNDPQGLAFDRAGHLYVADRGNHVIRRISASGEVTTVAGAPGEAGYADGVAAEARFSALRGLAMGTPWALYVVDGHSLRRLGADGRVTTLCGDPRRPGPSPRAQERASLKGVPCLDTPHALAAAWSDLYLTNRGGRDLLALRAHADGRVDLEVLAGDRAAQGTRYGLLRHGIEGPLDDGYAALADPRGLALDPRGDLFVADGTCVLHLCEPGWPPTWNSPLVFLGPGAKVPRGTEVTLDFFGPRPVSFLPSLPLDFPAHFFWTLEALDAKGAAVLPPVRGEVRHGNRGQARVTLPDPGPVTLRLTLVTSGGISSRATLALEVDEEPT